MALNVSEHVCTCSYAEYIDKEMLHEEAHSRHQNLSPPKGVHNLSCPRPSGRGLRHPPRGGNVGPKWGCHPGGRTGPPRTQMKTVVELVFTTPGPHLCLKTRRNIMTAWWPQFGRIVGACFGGPPAAPPRHPRNPCPWRRVALGFSPAKAEVCRLARRASNAPANGPKGHPSRWRPHPPPWARGT